MGVRLNAPYSIAYRCGVRNGKEHPEWTKQETEREAALYSMALMAGGRANRGAARYFRELAHVYIIAVEEGQTGTLITEAEWCEHYSHPWEIYHIMQMSNPFNSSKKLREIRESRELEREQQ